MESIRNAVARVLVGVGIYPRVKGKIGVPGDVRCYGVVDHSARMSHARVHKMARCIARNGLNSTRIEGIGWDEKKDGKLYWDEYKANVERVVAVMRIYGVTTCLTEWNDNVGQGKFGDTRKRPEAYGTEVFEDWLRFCASFGGSLMIYTPVSEGQSEWARKYMAAAMRAHVGHRVLGNWGSRPAHAEKDEWGREFHPWAIKDIARLSGPCVATTDTSKILNELEEGSGTSGNCMTIKEKVQEYVRVCRKAGVGVDYYDFDQDDFQEKCIEWMGEAGRG